ncbi:MAG: ribosome hibernation-promoting factor, HPF/YfiA family [Coraliomargaritaceae bacterium]|jgi:putative sigma-54 modulation protein|tara:strand:+ start:58 stop:429 length:372 start_codon:yes stop_codon:yes gene_type:complete
MKEQKKLIVAGKHLELTDSIKTIIEEKSEKLFSHNSHIVRMRVEVEYDPHQSTHQGEYIAKGHLEVRGNDHNVTVATNDLYKSIDLMVEKLDRMMRRRSRLERTKRKLKHDIDIPSFIPKMSS